MDVEEWGTSVSLLPCHSLSQNLLICALRLNKCSNSCQSAQIPMFHLVCMMKSFEPSPSWNSYLMITLLFKVYWAWGTTGLLVCCVLRFAPSVVNHSIDLAPVEPQHWSWATYNAKRNIRNICENKHLSITEIRTWQKSIIEGWLQVCLLWFHLMSAFVMLWNDHELLMASSGDLSGQVATLPRNQNLMAVMEWNATNSIGEQMTLLQRSWVICVLLNDPSTRSGTPRSQEWKRRQRLSASFEAGASASLMELSASNMEIRSTRRRWDRSSSGRPAGAMQEFARASRCCWRQWSSCEMIWHDVWQKAWLHMHHQLVGSVVCVVFVTICLPRSKCPILIIRFLRVSPLCLAKQLLEPCWDTCMNSRWA